MVGFSDVPLTLPDDAPTYYGSFEAKYVTEYFENYVDSHVYNGSSLRNRIFFGNHVDKVEKIEGSWVIRAQDSIRGERIFRSSRIAMATGLTSIPNIPSLPRSEDFEGSICHHKQWGDFSKYTLNTSDCKHVAVLGGAKSATDMVYECVKKGKSVSWIIRKSGEGPALFVPALGGGRYENSTEKGTTRLSAYFSPSSFMPNLWSTRLIHGTSIGRDYLRRKTQADDQSCRDLAAYRTREGALSSFQKLESTAS